MTSNNNGKRKFKWPIFTVQRRYRYTGIASYRIDISTPFAGFLFFLMMAFPAVLIGTLALVLHIAPAAAVFFLIVGCVMLLISGYAYLAYREEQKIQEEIKKQKAEKQKAWREKRRLEKRNGRLR